MTKMCVLPGIIPLEALAPLLTRGLSSLFLFDSLFSSSRSTPSHPPLSLGGPLSIAYDRPGGPRV